MNERRADMLLTRTVEKVGIDAGDCAEEIPAQVLAAAPTALVLVQDGTSSQYQAWLNQKVVGSVIDESAANLKRGNFAVWSLLARTRSGFLPTFPATLEGAADAIRALCGIGAAVSTESKWQTLKGVAAPFVVYGTATPGGIELAGDRTAVSGDPIEVARLEMRNRLRYGYTTDGREITFGGTATKVWIGPVAQNHPATVIVSTPVPVPAPVVETPNAYAHPDLAAMHQAVEDADRTLATAADYRARVQCTVIAAAVRDVLTDGDTHAPCDAASIAFWVGNDGTRMPHPVYWTTADEQRSFPVNDDFRELCALVGGLNSANRAGWEPLCTTTDDHGAVSWYRLDLVQAAQLPPAAPARSATARPDASRRAAALLLSAFNQKYTELPEFQFALYARGRYAVEVRGYMTDDQFIDFEPDDLAMLIDQLAAALSKPGGPAWDRALVAGAIEDMTVAWSLQGSFLPLSDSAAARIVPGWFTEEPPAAPLTDQIDGPVTAPLSARTKAEFARRGIAFL